LISVATLPTLGRQYEDRYLRLFTLYLQRRLAAGAIESCFYREFTLWAFSECCWCAWYAAMALTECFRLATVAVPWCLWFAALAVSERFALGASTSIRAGKKNKVIQAGCVLSG
jgi:hypothetical protein